eukprot:scaffold105590_cov17-Prasinocladus_malaysianus.AAC.1
MGAMISPPWLIHDSDCGATDVGKNLCNRVLAHRQIGPMITVRTEKHNVRIATTTVVCFANTVTTMDKSIDGFRSSADNQYTMLDVANVEICKD